MLKIGGATQCAVFISKNKPWGKGNNPKTAVWEFLKVNKNFEIDRALESKLVITGAPDGYLKKITGQNIKMV